MIDKKTKIVCTIGPAVEKVETMVELIKSGMDAARFNFSHGTHEIHKRYLENLNEACNISGRKVAIIQDLQGPKIRVGMLKSGQIYLPEGNEIRITSDDVEGDEFLFSTTYPGFIQDLNEGETLLLDDGNIKLEVTVVNPGKREITCRILTGGILKEHKGINAPNTALSLPSLTEKDFKDLAFGIEHKFDFVAMSFVRTADDIKLLKGIIKSQGKKTQVIAKIERPEAIINIDAIIEEADVIMIARGDMGVEISTEEVPLLQKMIIKKCNEKTKPVITATQMLESMIEAPTPTRAEASDIANSILDGTDCVMLSAETSTGAYPIETVRTMKKIIMKTETIKPSTFFNDIFVEDSPENTLHTICNSAVMIAVRVKAKVIITVTLGGISAILLSNHRPSAQIMAVSFEESVLKKMKLVWGVESMLMEYNDNVKDLEEQIKKRILDNKLFDKGDRIVFVSRFPSMKDAAVNMIQVSQL
ncbi:pyruvate kinase [soil metagenome]